MVYTRFYVRKKLVTIFLISFLVVCFLIGLFGTSVTAHSPSEMMLGYESVNQTLEVSITHQVSNPDTHYIYNIILKKNGETVNSYDYTSQPSSTSFTYTYDINATNGDVIAVVANCIQGGSISNDVTITAEGSSSGSGSSTPGFELITILTAITLAFILLKRKK